MEREENYRDFFLIFFLKNRFLKYMKIEYFQIFSFHIFRNWLFLSVKYNKYVELGFYMFLDL